VPLRSGEPTVLDSALQATRHSRTFYAGLGALCGLGLLLAAAIGAGLSIGRRAAARSFGDTVFLLLRSAVIVLGVASLVHLCRSDFFADALALEQLQLLGPDLFKSAFWALGVALLLPVGLTDLAVNLARKGGEPQPKKPQGDKKPGGSA
jgi:hypothetical protein